MEDAKKAFARRLREAMQAAGLEPKPSVLERGFNLNHFGKPMSLHGVRRWLRGETFPTQDKLLSLAAWLQVDPHLLRFGQQGPSVVREPGRDWTGVVGWSDRELMEAMRRLPAPQRKVLREVIQAFVSAYVAEAGTRPAPVVKGRRRD